MFVFMVAISTATRRKGWSIYSLNCPQEQRGIPSKIVQIKKIPLT